MQRYRAYLKEHNPSELRRIEARERRRQYNCYRGNKTVEPDPTEEKEEEEEERRNVGISSFMGLTGF